MYENLQLSHAKCNLRKHNRWDGTEPSETPAQLLLFAHLHKTGASSTPAQ